MSSAFQNPSLPTPLPPLIHPPTWRQYSREQQSSPFSSTSILSPAAECSPFQQSCLDPSANINNDRIIFTRQLWRRNMPNKDRTDERVLNKSHQRHRQSSSSSSLAHSDDTVVIPSKRTAASIASTQPRKVSSSLEQASRAPLTPDESPEVSTTRKRNASIAEVEDQKPDAIKPSVNSASSDRPDGGIFGEATSAVQVCICQPDPKIPRPRNAFILYRQHHQASVVAKNPGLANPEISKIIGEQWRNQPIEVKDEWKALAEEEKLRHQQQYPSYRYQPKRNTGRRNSASPDTPGSAGSERTRCSKCGGRTILSATAPLITSAPQHHQFAGVTSSPSTTSLPPPTPISSVAPVSHTIPPLRDLALQSPVLTTRRGTIAPPPPPSSAYLSRQMGQTQLAGSSHAYDERDRAGPHSPQTKRRRYESGDSVPRSSNGSSGGNSSAMQARYGTSQAHPHGIGPGPGTPFPFSQSPAHAFPPTSTVSHNNNRESLPGLRRVISPQASSAMVPPLRPGVGYQQHRISQGHPHADRSLTLPPLQTTNTATAAPSISPGILTTAGGAKSPEEIIMSMNMNYKIKVLGQISPPAPPKPGTERGLLIAVEGDSAAVATELSRWLRDTLAKENDRAVTLLEGPNVDAGEGKAMTRYHRLVAEWLEMSDHIMERLTYRRGSNSSKDGRNVPHQPKREEKEDVGSIEKLERRNSTSSTKEGETTPGPTTDGDHQMSHNSPRSLHKPQAPSATTDSALADNAGIPVMIIPNYSFHASNVFACQIPITDSYSPPDHWQWAATQWRGTAAPDLTVFVRDSIIPIGCESAKPNNNVNTGLTTEEDLKLFVVSRKGRGDDSKEVGEIRVEVEPSVLRRLAFEVNERVMVGGG